MWILGSLCDSLQEQVVTTPGNAKALWDHLKDLFHDNKDARAISLDNELRAVKIGKMSINGYCTKIKSMENRLKNLDCEVSEKNMVIYAVNGLDSRFATLAEIIRHREPLPSFETVRNMLLLKESSFNDSTDASTILESSSSSPTILMASSSSDAKGPGHVAHSVQQQQPTVSAQHPSMYMGQQQVQSGQPMTHINSQGILSAAPVMYALSQPTSLPSAFSTMTLQDPTWNMDTCATSHLNSNAHNLSTLFNTRLYSSIHVGDGNSIPVTNTDPTWNMDTCATSHLNSNAHNLSTLFNTRLYSSIHVGDGNSIPVTNTGHSIIHSLHRPLHLNNVLVTPNIIKNLISVRQFTRDNNCTIKFDAFGFSMKDFLTRHILLRCDSSGDLYPVTKPSTLPAAFVSTSSTMWHQRLGHPRDEVLRSLSSRHFISCNK
ncbi:ribonuclease H-like domain-containing protein [Tanacetum coccineum]|uniref:Ribonuclease H-like domain-containing protein n=1 Tax=Tanacetum coccineum TaxID=301880 RepID=A0ABQ5FTP5_9ASTR